MRLPRRSAKSISGFSGRQLPSLVTLFPTNQNRDTIERNETQDSPKRIEDGIELVPIERQDTSCAKILTPGQEEKEVAYRGEVDVGPLVKPLPSLPGTRWSRMPVKHRVLSILCIQFCMVLTIGLSLASVRRKATYEQGQEQSLESFAAQPSQQTAPLPMPSIGPIEHGEFKLEVYNPRQQSSACLAQSNESTAWVCSGSSLTMSLLPPPGGGGNGTFLSLGLPELPDGPPRYGSQPFSIGPIFLKPASDPNHRRLGPAYRFNAVYNRTVLLLEDRLTSGRQIMNLTENWGQPIRPGQRPWFCAFPETSIEGYIYVTRNTFSNRTAFRMPMLPYVVQLTEQRAPKGMEPYCEQKRLYGDGALVNLATAAGGIAPKTILKLNEFGSLSQRPDGSTGTYQHQEKRQQMQMANTCRCQWLIE